MEKKFTDVMIDIETLDTKPTSVILCIAAVAFDLETSDEAHYSLEGSVDYKEQIDIGRTTSIETTLWWGKQSPQANGFAFGQKFKLDYVLEQLKEYIRTNCVDHVRVWAKSPSFDLVILKDAFGPHEILPWKYSNERDIRTILSLVPDGIIEKKEVSHIALEDCLQQIEDVCKAYAYLKK